MAGRPDEEPIDIDFYAQQDGATKKKISYFYDASIGSYYYGRGHCMKPHRVKMVHALVMKYQMYKNLTVMKPPLYPVGELTRFHSDDYISFLRNVTTDNMHQYKKQLRRFNMVYDCPVFDGLIDFCQLYTSGSIAGASRLNTGLADISINWAGGLHHAKKNEASGFCYVNDCVLGILELLKVYKRVLYIDIDIHHGDGVEEAFYGTNRVMTCSFHKFGQFFPGTGALDDTGVGAGKGYSVNVPFHEGITDLRFFSMFKSVIGKINERFRPEAICLQCGADSLVGDKIGCFNLTLNGHAACVDYIRRLNVPLLVLGGGGYTMRNVARCWAFETAVLTGRNVDNAMPHNDYFEYYGPDYLLHIRQSNMVRRAAVCLYEMCVANWGVGGTGGETSVKDLALIFVIVLFTRIHL